MDSLTGAIRLSAVVLSELWRGATSVADREYLIALEEDYTILVPTEENWLDAGRVLAILRQERGLEPARLRGLHFDVLIALTARDHGFRLITSNRKDFELIRKYRDFAMEVWPGRQ